MHATSTAIAPQTFLAIITAGAIAATVGALAGRAGLLLPVVVLEVVAGVLLGPHVLGFQVTTVVLFFSNLGLALLFFFAGYEIEIRRIAGKPLRLGVFGWGVSLALAYASMAVLHVVGLAGSVVYDGSAVATTAMGTLIPILSDSGELHTPFGTYLLGAGAAGEFGPIVLITLALSTQSSLHNALILAAFIVLTLGVAAFAIRSSGITLPFLETNVQASAQLGVRWMLVLVFALTYVAYHLGLDLLLGGFAAGLITGEMLRGRSRAEFDSKVTAIAFGGFVPFFFIVSGMSLDISAFTSATGIARTLVFFILMLFVRGVPALLLYRDELDRRDRTALAFLCATQLPLVLAITALATAAGRISESVAADLVGAAVLSTLCYPLLGLRLRSNRVDQRGAMSSGASGGHTE
jgi:Kef-type K+ transport system membrane component KefB